MAYDLRLAEPESQGFASGRLARIRPRMQGYVDSGNFSGITTLLARRGAYSCGIRSRFLRESDQRSVSVRGTHIDGEDSRC